MATMVAPPALMFEEAPPPTFGAAGARTSVRPGVKEELPKQRRLSGVSLAEAPRSRLSSRRHSRSPSRPPSAGSFCAFAEERAAVFRLANPLPYFTRVGGKFETRRMHEWSSTHFTACRLRTTDMLLDAAMEAEVERVAAHLARTREQYLKETRAATTIQKAARGRQGRKRADAARALGQRRQEAAVQIQRVARGRLARGRVAELRRKAAAPASRRGDRPRKRRDPLGVHDVVQNRNSGRRRTSVSRSPAPAGGARVSARGGSPTASSRGGSPRASARGDLSPGRRSQFSGGPDSPASSRRSPGSRRNSGASGRSPKGGRRGKGSTHASEPPPEPKGTAAICGPRLLQAFEANPPVLQKVRASLQESPPLAALSLEHSALAAAGAVSLAKALLRNTSLVLLELKGNFIGDAGVQRIVAALEGSPGLARLGLSWNCIGDAGGMRVAESVGRLQGLRDLDLSYNRIGDASTDIMCMAMEASFSLKQADLRSNQFGPDSQGRLLEACAGKVALHLEGEPRALHVAAHKAEAKQRAPRGARGGGPRRASLSPAPSGRRGSRASQMR